MYSKFRECSLGLFAWETKTDGSKAWAELSGKTGRGIAPRHNQGKESPAVDGLVCSGGEGPTRASHCL